MSSASPILPHGGEMTIYHAAEHKEQLLGALAAMAPGAGTLELDLSQVTEFDTAGLQLLLLVRREALLQGRELRVLQPSAAAREVLDLANLAGHLGVAAPADGPSQRTEAR